MDTTWGTHQNDIMANWSRESLIWWELVLWELICESWSGESWYCITRVNLWELIWWELICESWFVRVDLVRVYLVRVDIVLWELICESWSRESLSGDSWSGESWFCESLSGDSWSGESWSGERWSGERWSRESWSGESWFVSVDLVKVWSGDIFHQEEGDHDTTDLLACLVAKATSHIIGVSMATWFTALVCSILRYVIFEYHICYKFLSNLHPSVPQLTLWSKCGSFWDSTHRTEHKYQFFPTFIIHL